MRYKTYRILHIPTAQIFTTNKSHSKTLKQFKKEVDIVFMFITKNINSESDLHNLIVETNEQLSKLSLYYFTKMSSTDIRFVNNCWISSFVDFVMNLFYSENDYSDIYKRDWSIINPIEFEVLDT